MTPDGWHSGAAGWALFAGGLLVAHVERSGEEWRWRIAYKVTPAFGAALSWEQALIDACEVAERARRTSVFFDPKEAGFLERLWRGQRTGT